ncbi:MAG TPA: hypothetical protein DEB09_04485 [Candidatus Magasanikbacteria bacterium]|nr:hypothetical protein [Candidatus Magasanikbacteria bacterium]
MFNIITIGDSTVDNFIIIDDNEASLQCDLNTDTCKLCFNYADKIPIKHTAHAVGGNAANIAVGCKKLGLKSAIYTEIGDDINGEIIKDELAKAKVSPDFIKVLHNQDSRYAVVLNYKSERTILSHYIKRKYHLPKLSKTDWLYYSSLCGDITQVQKSIIKYLKNNPNTKLAVNPGSHQIKTCSTELKKILPFTYLLFVNKEEARCLVGKKADTTQLIKSLHTKGVKIVVITDGTKGATASDGNIIYHMAIYPIKATGKTGAGDAFASGFLSAIHYGKNITEAMQWGTANAGGVIQQIGAQKGLLNKSNLEKLIKKYPKIIPRKI